MITPLHEVAIPEVRMGDIVGLSERLDRMSDQELPAFVIHEAGFSLQAAMQHLRPVLEGHQFDVWPEELESINFDRRENIFPADAMPHEDESMRGSISFDVGFHFDKLPQAAELTLTTHLTTHGEADVRLLEPTRRFFDEASAQHFKVAPGLKEDLRKDCVNTEYLNSECHLTHVKPGSLLVFRLGGLVPLVHDFKTAVSPRGAETDDIVRQLQ